MLWLNYYNKFLSVCMKKILIVDDNDDFRMLLRIMLSEYETIEAVNGSEAVDLYHQSKPDLVLMDILMPIKDGIEATKEILQSDPEANIFAITAYHDQEENILKVGARRVIKKPFRKNDFLEIVRNSL